MAMGFGSNLESSDGQALDAIRRGQYTEEIAQQERATSIDALVLRHFVARMAEAVNEGRRVR